MSHVPKTDAQPLLCEKDIWTLLVDILPVLQTLHRQGQIHGNIQPANVRRNSATQHFELLQPEPQPSDLVDLSGTATSSPEYAAPEQLWGQPTPLSDLYSLGITCIHFLTGLSPFEWLGQPDADQCWADYLAEPLSPALRSLMSTLAARSQQERYSTVDAVLEAMRQAGVSLHQRRTIKVQQGAWRCVQTLTADAPIHAVAIHPMQRWVFGATEKGHIQGWDGDLGHCFVRVDAHSRAIAAIAISPDGQLLITASDDKTAKLWQVGNTGMLTPLVTLATHTHCAKTAAFSADGQYFATGSWDKTLNLGCTQTHKILRIFEGAKLPISAMSFCPTHAWLASGTLDGEITICHYLSQDTVPLLSIRGQVGAVTALTFSPDGDLLVSGSANGSIYLWHLSEDPAGLRAEGQQVLSAHSWTVSGLAVLSAQPPHIPDPYLISTSWDHSIKVWNLETGDLLAVLEGHTDTITAFAFSPVHQFWVTGSHDRTLRLWR